MDRSDFKRRLSDPAGYTSFCDNFDELNEASATLEHRVYITNALFLWDKFRDYRQVDKMVGYCFAHSLLLTPEMIKAAGELALARLNGDIKETTKNMLNVEEKSRVLLEMWSMINYCSLTLDQAAINGVKILKFKNRSNKKIKMIKAVALKKEYRVWKEKQKDTNADRLKILPSWPDSDIEKYIKQFELIDLDDWELGEMR